MDWQGDASPGWTLLSSRQQFELDRQLHWGAWSLYGLLYAP